MDAATVDALFARLCAQVGRDSARREAMRCWSLSGVERVRFGDGSTLVFKYACAPFEHEPAILAHAARCGLPVPRLAATAEHAGAAGMFMQDLGDPQRDATLTDAAAIAVAVHAAEPMAVLPVLDAAALAALPTAGLESLGALRERGRWAGTDDIHDRLSALEAVAKQRADGAERAPFGLCHSEFHSTSIHVGAAGIHVLDFARVFIGPGLLDLASWSGTIEPPDLPGLRQLLTAYVAAGGHSEVFADRGGLPAERWAYGMHRLWVVAWYLAQQTTWIDDETEDPTYQQVVRRHLGEAAQCLT